METLCFPVKPVSVRNEEIDPINFAIFYLECRDPPNVGVLRTLEYREKKKPI